MYIRKQARIGDYCIIEVPARCMVKELVSKHKLVRIIERRNRRDLPRKTEWITLEFLDTKDTQGFCVEKNCQRCYLRLQKIKEENLPIYLL